MCLFICFTTKAVHIELANDLSTSSFLNCLKRFISRRGLCKRLYSDNATNFVGAQNELMKIAEFVASLNKNKDFNKFCLESYIEWKHIPPRSPHHGGLWESAIKSAKHHITRVVGNVNLTFEEMSTLFTQIEAILNSRPLTPLSSDPHDLLPLTPGHFLIGDALNTFPQRDVSEQLSNRLNQYHLLQKMQQQFWVRWSTEYLSQLQQRAKWQHTSENLKPGSMVVLRDEGTPPLNWRLGRVVELHPGQDGLVRVVSVRTSSGITRRATQKLCLLPIETSV